MVGTRHEEYGEFGNGLPFSLNIIKRTCLNCSKQSNWHENLEIQLCDEGSGEVWLNGKIHPFSKGDIATVCSDVIHYTGTADSIKYSCLIISNTFCRQIGIDCEALEYEPIIRDEALNTIFEQLKLEYADGKSRCRTAKLNALLISLLISLTENHLISEKKPVLNKTAFTSVKSAIKYMRQNYMQRLTLDKIAEAACMDKYELCRAFKRFTNQTVIEYLNCYRCQAAAELLYEGYTVYETAHMCGFENPSFFTKTFKRYTSALPSDKKRKN